MKLRSEIISLLLCAALFLSLFAGCGVPEDSSPVSSPDTVPEKAVEPFTFKTHVYNCFLEEAMGEKMHEAYDNLIDAVIEGKDSFECADKETYDWVMGQLPHLCFPVVDEYIDYNTPFTNYADGIGYINYKIPVDEFLVKLDEFEKLITDILNEALRTDYTDLEKMIALYGYFADNYTYDYDLYELTQKQYVDNNGAYHLFNEKKDICAGISVAYSYLLMQAGLDACVVKGPDHQWSIVKYNGNYYHIDPTFGLGDSGSLLYFMMDDDQRSYTGFYPEDYVFFSVYTQEHPCSDYPCTDSSFSILWDYWYKSLDHDSGTITCLDSALPDSAEEYTFDSDRF